MAGSTGGLERFARGEASRRWAVEQLGANCGEPMGVLHAAGLEALGPAAADLDWMEQSVEPLLDTDAAPVMADAGPSSGSRRRPSWPC